MAAIVVALREEVRALPYTIADYPDDQCVVVAWRGDIGLETIRGFIEDIVALPAFFQRSGQVHDMRAAEFTLTPADLDTARTLERRTRDMTAQDRRMAVIVKSAVQFGQVRQFMTKLDTTANLLVTYSEAEAKAFAGLPDHIDLSADGA